MSIPSQSRSMSAAKPKAQEATKSLHPRNRHNDGYDFESLVNASPALESFVVRNKYGNLSVNFFDAAAVRELNRALLRRYYNIEYWDIPQSALTPPIPGRADYLHYMADLLQAQERTIRVLDIGTGASCIYPIIGRAEYGWDFVASDIEPRSLESSRVIIERNDLLRDHVELREQHDAQSIFKGVISATEQFDLTICNPPFHDSKESAERGTLRKLSNLKGQKARKAQLNFSGTDNELWCEGGERAFVLKMIRESRLFARQVGWFSTLVSKEDNLRYFTKELTQQRAREHRVVEMLQGNKRTRVLAWRF